MQSSKLKIVIYAITTVFSKGVSQLFINKLVSSTFGPQGLGIFGIWQNLSQIVVSFSNGAINNGIVISVAEAKDNPDKIKKILSSAFAISLTVSLVLSIALILFFPILKLKFLSNSVNGFNIYFLVLTLPLIAWSICLSNVQNGLQSTNDQLLTNVLVPTIYLGLVYLSIHLHHLNLAISSLTCAQVLPFFILIFFVKKRLSFWPFVKPQITSYTSIFFKHSLMSIAFTLSFPLATFIIRQQILKVSSLESAGYFDSLARVSAISSAMMSAVVSIYFLPTLSRMNKSKIVGRYHRFYSFLLVAFALGVLIAYFLGAKLIVLLYSDKFLYVSAFFWMQIVGDFFKTISFINMNYFVSRNLVGHFVVLELSSSAIYLTFCFILGFSQLEHIIWAYISAYFLYSITSYIVLRSKIRGSYDISTAT